MLGNPTSHRSGKPHTRKLKLQSRYTNLAVVMALIFGLFAQFISGTVPAKAAGFTTGNLIVYRVGDGSAALGTGAAAVYLDEYSPSGSLVQSVPLPTTANGSNKRLVASGSSTSEGLLTLSSDNRYLLLTGYDAATGTASIAGTTGAVAPRVVGRVDGNATIDTTTALTDFASGGNPRSVASTNGTDLWVTGSAGGVRYATLGGTTSTQLSTTGTNLRQVNIFNGQLYTSTSSGTTFRVGAVGSGTPTTAGQTITNLPGFPTSGGSPYGFFFADLTDTVPGQDTLYVADDAAGIQKYSLVGGNWVLNGTITASGVRGLTGAASGTNVALYGSTAGSLYSFTDTTGYNAAITGSATAFATANANTAFRGIAFAPAPVPVVPSITTQPASATISSGATASLSVVAAGTNLSYQWYQGNKGDTSTPVGTNSANFTTPALTATTNYWVRVSNNLGSVDSDTAIITIAQVIIAPSITTQPASTTINTGSTATLSVEATGTAPLNYQWYQGSAPDTSTPVGTNSPTFTTPTLTALTNYWVQVSNGGGSVNSNTATVTVNVPVLCSAVDTPIHAVQGAGNVAAITGTVTVQGVVVGDYEGPSPALRGFYLQELNPDADPATSEGIFVFDNGADLVSVGQVVQVTGTVSEFQEQTQISSTSLENCGTTASVTPADISLPIPAPVNGVAYLERYEGMLVRFPQTLYVTEHFQLGRFGQVVMSSNNRLPQPTNIVDPGAPAQAQQAANNLNRLIVDDADQTQNPDPIRFGRGGNPLSATNTLRGGDSATGMVGVMSYTWAGNAASGNAYRLRPINALGGGVPNFQPTGTRPAGAPNVGGTLKVASFNVLNYFLTLDIGTQANCGPLGNKQECRGAETPDELTRQQQKLNAALIKLDADVFGLMELENTQNAQGQDVNPLADIVARLNSSLGSNVYSYINTGIIGSDTIRVGIIYKNAKVTPVGSALVDTNPIHNRPPVAQLFSDNATGEKYTVIVNHLKSKGSCPTAVGDPDADSGDGQACWNATRVQQAQALLAFINGTVVPTTGDTDVLLIGDFNSYAKEDPIKVLEAAGFTNLVSKFSGPEAYSYAFDGQWGYLDQGLASASLLPQITGASDYHINSDEPSVLDYNTNFKTAGQVSSLYNADEFRTSDHDPVVIGLNLNTRPAVLQLTVPTTATVDVPVSLTITIKDAYGNIANGYTGTIHFSTTDSKALLPTDYTFTAQDGGTHVFNGALTFKSAGTQSITVSDTQVAELSTTQTGIVVSPGAATVTLSNLSQLYDGTPKFATASTQPSGLLVDITYSQGGNVVSSPTNAGSYTVTATVNDPNYTGTTTGTLVIDKAATTTLVVSSVNPSLVGQAVTFTAQVSASQTVTTKPSGSVTFSIDGVAQTPVNIDANGKASFSPTTLATGNRTITASYTGNNNFQTSEDTLTQTVSTTTPAIKLAVVAVKATYGSSVNLKATLTNKSKPVSGKTISFVLNGQQVCGVGSLPACPTTDATGVATLSNVTLPAYLYPGTYSAGIVATVVGEETSGSATLTISKATATVTLSNLIQTYDGSPKFATVTTNPAGLSVIITYTKGGIVFASPTNAGSYNITATIDDPRYSGKATGALVIGKATPNIILGNLSQMYDGTGKYATATTEPAGLKVTFSYAQGGVAVSNPTKPGNYDVTAKVNEANYNGTTTGVLVITPGIPTVKTGAVKNVKATSATLTGTVNANFAEITEIYFEWGIPFDSQVNKLAVNATVTGNTNVTVSAALTGLDPNTSYYYRLVVKYGNGSQVTSTVVTSFRTLAK